GLVRARRAMRRPHLLVQFGPAFAQQAVERLLRGDAAEAAHAQILALAAAWQVGFGQLVFVLVREAELVFEARIEPADRRAGELALRRFGEAFWRGFSRRVRGGEIAAAVERIVRRRLDVGLRPHAG